MATTFEQWKDGRQYFSTMGADAIGHESEPGWMYEAGFIVDASRNPIQGDGERFAFYVPLPTEDRGFHSFDDAEAFLWREWCGPEINGAPV